MHCVGHEIDGESVGGGEKHRETGERLASAPPETIPLRYRQCTGMIHCTHTHSSGRSEP